MFGILSVGKLVGTYMGGMVYVDFGYGVVFIIFTVYTVENEHDTVTQINITT